MLQLSLYLTVIFVSVVSEQCQYATFNITNIRIDQGSTSLKQKANECITPQTINYGRGRYLEIHIENATNIPTLYEGAIANFPEPIQIYIQYSNVKTIKENAFLNLKKVEAVNFYKTQVEWIDLNVFTNMPNLDLITFRDSKIQQLLDETFHNLPKLRTLDLTTNLIDVFRQEWLSGVPTLDAISLCDNKIRKLSRRMFNLLPTLTFLDLSVNQIEKIDRDAFEGLRNLNEVNLGENRIKKLDINFNTLLNFRILQIFKNNITYVSEDSLSSLTMRRQTLCYIDITANPLQCSCFNKLVDWGNNNQIRIKLKCNDETPICINPRTNVDHCIEREDKDFYSGYHTNFNSNCDLYMWQCN